MESGDIGYALDTASVVLVKIFGFFHGQVFEIIFGIIVVIVMIEILDFPLIFIFFE